MLPQPNFGRDKEPVGPGMDADGAMPRKKLFRLRIAMWVQVVCAVLGANLYAFSAIASRSVSEAELLEYYEQNPPVQGEPAEVARRLHETFQSTGFLVATMVIAGFTVVAAIVLAMCALRLKSRLKVVRWWAVGATAILFVIGMYMSINLGFAGAIFLIGAWVFASVLTLWWLFSSDIRYWLSERPSRGAEAGEAED